MNWERLKNGWGKRNDLAALALKAGIAARDSLVWQRERKEEKKVEWEKEKAELSSIQWLRSIRIK